MMLSSTPSTTKTPPLTEAPTLVNARFSAQAETLIKQDLNRVSKRQFASQCIT